MLFLDLETYSDVDIKTASLDRYASHPSTRILMCAYAGDTGPVEIWEEGQPGLPELQSRMAAETCIAWNVSFERTLTEKAVGWRLRNVEWWDAMVLSLYAGLPAGLKDCNRVPYFANEAETSKESGLIGKFCKPQKDGSRRGPDTDPEDWARFCQYCKDDVADHLPMARGPL